MQSPRQTNPTHAEPTPSKNSTAKMESGESKTSQLIRQLNSLPSPGVKSNGKDEIPKESSHRLRSYETKQKSYEHLADLYRRLIPIEQEAERCRKNLAQITFDGQAIRTPGIQRSYSDAEQAQQKQYQKNEEQRNFIMKQISRLEQTLRVANISPPPEMIKNSPMELAPSLLSPERSTEQSQPTAPLPQPRVVMTTKNHLDLLPSPLPMGIKTPLLPPRPAFGREITGLLSLGALGGKGLGPR